ncbi:unnamed protein product [Thlaspi arvense]|uniref:Defensin-like protein n=1 Tax=Thlaspi arvense TaxID=13288 RepID=A0AAU9T425_THLAR|nr:unnamed protein product [Thlaspi arvense]
MQRITSLTFLVTLLIVFTSVVNQSRAATCNETLGSCENCDKKCLTKYGPSVKTHCDGPGGMCTCVYGCGPPSPIKPMKVCIGSTGLCTSKCAGSCCDRNCALKYNAGRGACSQLGDYIVCECEYTC